MEGRVTMEFLGIEGVLLNGWSIVKRIEFRGMDRVSGDGWSGVELNECLGTF